MLNFDFWEKRLGVVSSPHFVYYFLLKMFLMLYSINRPNFIQQLFYFPDCDVMNFESNLIFPIKPFFYMTKKSWKKKKKKKSWQRRALKVEEISISQHFKSVFSGQKLCQTWECTDCMFLSCHVRVSEWIYTQCQGTPSSKVSFEHSLAKWLSNTFTK